ncbi:MAG: Spo0E family sporulation regulatory protein-aspartic acid phosphatase [Tissierellaceae bacterium]|nr:Spo0E family sporulation regulatory protein-aspartic acid phosphatase [Tissierellaceae bacterium]
MENTKKILKLKEGIRKKQEELNEVINREIDKDKILKLSQELDKLITFYYME